MNQYQKDLNYVTSMFKRSYDMATLHHAQRLKRGFYDKYTILISPTDTEWLKVKAELDELDSSITKRLTSNYLFQ